MSDRADVMTTAVALIRQYGDDAEVIAVMRAAELAAMGDAEALAHWDEVIRCIAELHGDSGERGDAPLH
jgi:hypothetical protein